MYSTRANSNSVCQLAAMNAGLDLLLEVTYHFKNALSADLQGLFIGPHFLPCLINEMAHMHRQEFKTVNTTRQRLL